MNTFHHPLCAALAFAVGALSAVSAQADTIINLKGFGSDGAGVTIPLGYPLPVGTVISMVNPVRVDLKAGDYLLSDAWGQPGALYDAWNYEVSAPGSWDSHFYAAVQQGSSSSYTLLLDALEIRNPDCRSHNCSWSTEAEASAAFLQTPAFRLHLAQDTVVAFTSTDYDLSDNAGGMSVAISGAVPEPSAWALMGGGLLLLGAIGCRRLHGDTRD